METVLISLILLTFIGFVHFSIELIKDEIKIKKLKKDRNEHNLYHLKVSLEITSRLEIIKQFVQDENAREVIDNYITYNKSLTSFYQNTLTSNQLEEICERIR